MADIVKKSSLAGLAEGWDETCFAYVKPATYEDRKKFRELIDSNDEGMDFQRELVKAKFVKGVIKRYDLDKDAFVEAPMTEEDLDINVVNDRLAMDIMGFDLDPKELAASLAAAQSNAPTSTETPSSEDSPEA